MILFLAGLFVLAWFQVGPKEAVDFLTLLAGLLETAVAFVKAILIPVAPAAVIIAFLIDHLLKRLPFWKDGWAGWANLVLNLLFSAGLFLAARAGLEADYLKLLDTLGYLLPTLAAVAVGIATANKAHSYLLYLGIGKSISGDLWGTIPKG